MPGQKEMGREKNQKEKRQTDRVNEWFAGTMEWKKKDRSTVRKGYGMNADSYVFAVLGDKNALQLIAVMVCTILWTY